MRLFSAAAAFAVTVTVAFSEAAARGGVEPPSAVAKETSQASMLEYYPAPARAAGVGGAALLQCRLNEHVRLTGCTLSGESPAGYGFGEAALQLARLSPDNPTVTQAPRAQILVQFTFTPNPASIRPDTLVPLRSGFVGTGPRFREKPNFAALKYPDLAARTQTQGFVLLDCWVAADGTIKSCAAASEQPAGFHFGEAASNFGRTFKLRPTTIDGQPTESHVLIPINFERR